MVMDHHTMIFSFLGRDHQGSAFCPVLLAAVARRN